VFFFFAIPFSQLVDYGRVVVFFLLAFAPVAGIDHLAALVAYRAHFDSVLRAQHDPLLHRDRSECQNLASGRQGLYVGGIRSRRVSIGAVKSNSPPHG
jgi:hypothetical protein